MTEPADRDLSGADRVLAVLKMLAERPNGVRLDDLRRELGAPKSTAHRILGTLCRSGLASKDDEGRYSLSMEFLRLAFRHYESLDDRNVVQGVLDALVERFGETAYYARLDGAEVVYVGMQNAPGYLHTASAVGARAPAHRTSLGKAMLAYVLADRAAVNGFVDEYGPLLATTPTSVTNAAALDRELAATRARGWAMDNEENEIGVVCVGFPLFLGPTSRPSGAVSVAAIKLRTPLDKLVARTDEIRELIERHLGPGALPPRAERLSDNADPMRVRQSAPGVGAGGR
jgi:IclR family transcriptional regulator, acetate operon repressor